jgi:acyl dehydratase
MNPYDHLRGIEIANGTCAWDEDRVMLYAVGVGAGLHDPADELQFTTENTPGQPLQVLPGFLATLNVKGKDWTRMLGWDGPGGYPVGLVHGEQSVTLFRAVPTSGTLHLRRVIEGVYDKGTGALLVMDTEIRSADGGEPIAATRAKLFAQGKGGFGGPRGPADEAMDWRLPDRAPDMMVSLPVGLNQSLIYRLMGDHREHGTLLENARADGFDRPVFYGLGSFGLACRALVKGLCGGDVARFGHIETRNAKPVYPGDRLDTQIWRTADGALFRVLANGERVSLDRGRFRLRGAE